MKKIIVIAILGFFSLGSYAQCSQFYSLKEGTTWQISNYDAKGKFNGKSIQKVTAYNESSNGFEATLEITSVDKKGEQMLVGSTKLKCEDGVIYFDLEDMFPSQTMESIENFDMSIEGTNLELPKNLKVGQTLKDAEIIMHIDASPMKMTFKVNIIERTVLAEEHLNTPAGEFDCFKISQKIYLKAMIKIETSTIEWYSYKVGMVKSETYNKKGKLKEYSLLTAYSY